eukprot:m.1287928 g.1287928  ORF g.1287928 m.1287928 type:complete len:124 (-) comp24781_c0_seq39:7552-7923(-)
MAHQRSNSSPTVGAHVAGKSALKRRKRQTKEPKREDYIVESEYQEAFMEWRRFRSFQQQSVARSRAKAKQVEYEQELQIRATERDNAMLEKRITELERSISVFVEMIKQEEMSQSQLVPSIDG